MTLKIEDELKLINQARSGDNDAFLELYGNYKNLIKSKARSYYMIGAEIEDLVQEGFIGFFKAIRDYDDSLNIPFYSFVNLCVTRNIITAIKTNSRMKHIPLNYYKSLNVPIFCDASLTLGDTLALPNDNPEEKIITKEFWDGLLRFAEQNFSELEQQVFKYYLKGYSFQLIADKLEVTFKAVDNAVWRIKRKFRKYNQQEFLTLYY